VPFVPLTVIVNDPVGVDAVVEMLRLVLVLLPVVGTGFVPNVAAALAGRPAATRVTLHGLVFPPTVRLTV
jgi:hypothetical protein